MDYGKERTSKEMIDRGWEPRDQDQPKLQTIK